MGDGTSLAGHAQAEPARRRGWVSRLARHQSIGLGRKDEIALGQSVNLVGPDCYLDQPPRQRDVRMMALLLRHFSDTHGKVQRPPEVLERIRLLEVMLVDDLPTAAQLELIGDEFVPLQRGHPAAAGYTLFRCQIVHVVVTNARNG